MVAVALVLGGETPADVTESTGDPPTQPLILEDPPQPLRPDRPRSEADLDRIEAMALFSAARIKHRRQDYAGALRLYQRAVRYDPQAESVLKTVVVLASQQDRQWEAARYAELGDFDGGDPLLFRKLGVFLTQHGQPERAVVMFEKALATREGTAETAADAILHMESGRLCFLVGQHEKAAEHFAAVCDALEHPDKYGLDPSLEKLLLGEASTAYQLFGESFLEAGRLDEATKAFEKAREASADEAVLAYNQARVHYQAGELVEALAKLQVYLDARSDKRHGAPYQLLAKLLKDLDRGKELIGRLESLHRADPKNAALGYALAEQYFEVSDLNRAEPLYRQLAELDPRVVGSRRLIHIYRKTGRPEELLDVLVRAVAKNADLQSLDEEAGEIAGDEALVTRLLELVRRRVADSAEDSTRGPALAAMLLALESKRHDVVGEFFDLTFKADPEGAADLFMLWGVALLMEDRPAEAAEVFRRGIDEIPDTDLQPYYYFYLAGALELDGRTDDALAAAREAAELQEESARLASREAWVLYHAERYPAATEAYKKLLDRFDSQFDSERTRDALRAARLVLSNICVVEDDLAGAEEWLQQVLDEFPDDISAANDLGYLWADQDKHLQRALGMIEKAIEAEPDNTAYRDSLGWVYFRLGRYPEAIAELEKAVRLDEGEENEGSDAMILDHLGDACDRAGRSDQAIQTWKRAVEAHLQDKKPKEAAKVRAKIKALKKRKPKAESAD